MFPAGSTLVSGEVAELLPPLPPLPPPLPPEKINGPEPDRRCPGLQFLCPNDPAPSVPAGWLSADPESSPEWLLPSDFLATAFVPVLPLTDPEELELLLVLVMALETARVRSGDTGEPKSKSFASGLFPS